MQDVSLFLSDGSAVADQLGYPGYVIDLPNMGDIFKAEVGVINGTEVDSWVLKDGNNVVHEPTSLQSDKVIFEDATGFIAPFGLYCGGVLYCTMAAE